MVDNARRADNWTEDTILGYRLASGSIPTITVAILLVSGMALRLYGYDKAGDLRGSAVPFIPSSARNIIGSAYDHQLVVSRTSNGECPIVEARSFATLQAAIDHAATLGSAATVIIDEVEPVLVDLRVPANITLQFCPAGQLQIGFGVAVALDCPERIQASHCQQIFSGFGSAYFTNSGTVFPAWWGAKGDGVTDDTCAIQAALDGFRAIHNGVLQMPSGSWMFTRLVIPKGIRLTGDGAVHSLLQRLPGSTDVGITDGQADAGGVNIIIENLCIDGGNCAGNLIQLGWNTNQLGSYSILRSLLIRNTQGWGIRVNGNVGYFDTLEFWNCGAGGMFLGGSGSIAHNLAFSGCGSVALHIAGPFNRLSGLHFEGPYDTACVKIDDDCSGNVLSGVFAYLGAGNDADCIVRIGSNDYGTVLMGLSASIISSQGSAVTNGLVYDTTYGARRVFGSIYGTDYHFLPRYDSGRGTQIPSSDTVPPATGTWVTGDWFVNPSGEAGFASGFQCVCSGTPGVWSPTGTLPGAVAVTKDYSVQTVDNGKRFSNHGATVPVKFLLPAASPGMVFHFIRLSSYRVQVCPVASERIRGGKVAQSLFLVDDGDSMSLMCIIPGIWETTGGYGARVFEP